VTAPKRFLITTLGSTGDHFPLFAIGAELRRRGHAVTFATSDHFRQDVETAGLDFLELPPKWSEADFAGWMERMMRTSNPVQLLRLIYRSLAPHLAGMIDRIEAALPSHDLLLGSFLTPYLHEVARRHERPYLSAAFAHNILPSLDAPPHPIPILPGSGSAKRAWAGFWWRAADRTIRALIESEIGPALRSRSIPPVAHFFTRPADRILALVNPNLFPARGQLLPGFHYTGACRWQPGLTQTDTSELRASVGGQPVPVLTFGSMGYSNPDAWLQRLIRHWPDRTPLIVQSGWAGFSSQPNAPWLRIVGKMPQDALFSLASVVIHHGGAGTTATALASGKPQIIVPHVAEQGFWSREIRRLGCGVRLSRHHWPERLHKTIQSVLSSPTLRATAQRIRPEAASETGPSIAANLLEMGSEK
jgi:UDP:flavonoid glycosyltransferase YjiC (YdhE family)